MYMFKPVWLVVRFVLGGMLLGGLTLSATAQSPGLGKTMTAAEVEAIDFTVLPDGSGLPPGQGDARAGAAVYQQHCLACHGNQGEGGLNDRLAGGHGSLSSSAPVKTLGSYWPEATTVFDFIRRSMPYTAPGSLTNDEVFALTGYLLFINDVVAEDAVLNAQTLPEVDMPNAGNFVWAVAQ